MSQPIDVPVVPNSHSEDRDEGILSDVLDELDRERLRRAELEAEIRKLHADNDALRKLQQQQQRHEDEATPKRTELNDVSQRVFVAMETQVQGYQQLVDALTLGKPAIAAAAAEEESLLVKKKSMITPTIQHRFGSFIEQQQQRDINVVTNNKRKTLPLHIVRLLEVLPWDPKTQQHIFAVEEIYEWQTYQENVWQSQLQCFPTLFKTLPLIKAEAISNSSNGYVDDQANDAVSRGIDDNKKDNRNFLQFLAGADLQRKQNKYRIFTDGRLSVLYDLDAGYPLPSNDGGVWEWVGSWRVSSRTTTGSITEALDSHEIVDSDQHGWSYVVEPRDFLLGLKDMVWDNAGITSTSDKSLSTSDGTNENRMGTPSRPFRRRRWVRRRVLVDYLSASESTKQYLKLLSENARLSLSAAKISEQLIETKLLLTETEEKLVHANDLLHQQQRGIKVSGDIVEQSKTIPSSSTTTTTTVHDQTDGER
jgi:hypothetical protein